jgi:ferrous iron transport protein A
VVDDLTLDKQPPGSVGVITAVGGEGALRCRLLDMGLIPRTKVKVVKTAPLGDPVEIRLRDYELTIRLADAALIEIEPLTDEYKVPAGGAAE